MSQVPVCEGFFGLWKGRVAPSLQREAEPRERWAKAWALSETREGNCRVHPVCTKESSKCLNKLFCLQRQAIWELTWWAEGLSSSILILDAISMWVIRIYRCQLLGIEQIESSMGTKYPLTISLNISVQFSSHMLVGIFFEFSLFLTLMTVRLPCHEHGTQCRGGVFSKRRKLWEAWFTISCMQRRPHNFLQGSFSGSNSSN